MTSLEAKVDVIIEVIGIHNFTTNWDTRTQRLVIRFTDHRKITACYKHM